MSDISNRFAEYVTGMSFVLVLSKRQVSYMNSLAFPKSVSVLLMSRAGADTGAALERKGLVEYVDGHYQLTKAGKLLIPLLDLAGLLAKDPKIPLAVPSFKLMQSIVRKRA